MALNPNISTNNIISSGKLPVINPTTSAIEYYSVQPDASVYGDRWVASGAIPKSFSVGGWTSGNKGYVQQTFLGASIIDFSMNGGFGDTSSTLSVNLINDEYNKSDRTVMGYGDDVYHSGIHDRFAPPMVGSPVFFKFGKNLATVRQAYLKTFDDIYGYDTIGQIAQASFIDTGTMFDNDPINNPTESLKPNYYVDIETKKILDYTPTLSSDARGKDHLVFGGILQTYTQNRGMGGNPQYSVQVIDPREILSNVVLILNNYAGTVYNNKNILNIYGFLEYNLPEATIKAKFPTSQYNKSVLTKNVGTTNGNITYSGNDRYNFKAGIPIPPILFNSIPQSFAITGTGFSRRSSQGIPYYRVRDAVNALMEKDGVLLDEYKNAGFGGVINFRGFNYVVDLSGLPSLPNLYYLDFDQINLLDLCMEICDITSHDMFVSLLPIIDHPACEFLAKYNANKIQGVYNANQIQDADKKKKLQSEVIAGIIRVDTVNRSIQPQYGAIKQYIDNLAANQVYVENQDVGYELSNVTTDKFIVGAQEVDMYYFSSNADRDTLEVRKKLNGVAGDKVEVLLGDQWKLETSLKQQILPYYGKLGSNAISIPKGFGSYQQILLDATAVNANGLGAYYVATEMELRCALISFERWKNFLLTYNDLYMESIEENDAEEIATLQSTPSTRVNNVPFGGNNIPHIPNGENVSNNYAVSVPRSVFPSYIPGEQNELFGLDGLPKSPCNPPYGYPLYYKRANKIGIPEAGLTEISARLTTMITSLAALKSSDQENFHILLNSEWSRLEDLSRSPIGLSQAERDYFNQIRTLLNTNDAGTIAATIGLIETNVTAMSKSFQILPKIAKKGTENALRVYNFVKQIAEECLGKKFLVKIPKEVNLFYTSGLALKSYGSQQVNLKVNELASGMFGFRPLPISSGIGYEFTPAFKNEVKKQAGSFNIGGTTDHCFHAFLSSGINPNPSGFAGALAVNYNPIADMHEFNYTPNKDGGYFNFDLYDNVMTFNQVSGIVAYNNKPIGVQCLFVPQDLTNFISDNGRVSAYARFDHSQNLALDGLNPDSYTQQSIVSNAMIPDISESLNNTRADVFHSFPSPYTQDANPHEVTTPSVAFVKCDIDDKFYMPPKMFNKNTYVYGTKVTDIGRISKPIKIYKPCPINDYFNSVPYYVAHFIPKSGEVTGGNNYKYDITDFKHKFDPILNSNIINTDLEDLDTDHVYALITLPGKILPTQDARFRDGQMQQDNVEKIKHFLTMDTVKKVRGFDLPADPRNAPTHIINAFKNITPTDARDQAFLAAKAAISNLTFAEPYQINASMPSPVYPDLIALPLMSRERCYGPWISSQLDGQANIYQNIGGRVEFIKDENLAPWNFDGYQLMNYAGRTQAEFSNSMLLFSERGGFVVPDVPQGASLCRALIAGGPLVTNINVEIGSNGVKTTFKLDLYTASFGKLQKQKQDAISKISRERQKLKDEKNALIRKGLGKSQKNDNYKLIQEALFNNMNSSSYSNVQSYASSQNRASSPNLLVASNRQDTQNTYSPDQPNDPLSHTTHGTSVSMQNVDTLSQTSQSFPDQLSFRREYYNSAAQSMDEHYVPASYDPYHPNMAYRHDPMMRAKTNLYYPDGVTPPTDTTIYEV
jgi:hypothetical protein